MHCGKTFTPPLGKTLTYLITRAPQGQRNRVPDLGSAETKGALGPVVRRPISANLRLNFFSGFLFLLFESIFSGNFLYVFTIIQSSYYRQKELN